MLRIIHFDDDPLLMEEFQEFATKLYDGDPYWMGRDLAFPESVKTRYFLVFENGRAVGRTAAIENSALVYQGLKTGLIGLYECVDDFRASQFLIDGVVYYFRERGFQYLLGPLNGSTWYSYRVTEPGGQPFLMDNYNKDWYTAQFTGNGFQVIARYSSARVSEIAGSFGRLARLERYFANKGITVRPVNLNDFEGELRKIYTISLSSFQDNFLYTPISEREFQSLYQRIKSLVDPRFVLIAENFSSEPLGFIFAVPNAFKKERRSLVIKTVAVVPRSEARGLGALMAEMIHRSAFEDGYQEVIHALMHERNGSNNISRKNSRPFRSYLLFGRNL